MKPTYFLGIDAAKHKMRAAEKDLPVQATGLRQLLAAIKRQLNDQGKTHEVALRHLMRILTRRLVAVLRSGKPYQSHYNLKNAA